MIIQSSVILKVVHETWDYLGNLSLPNKDELDAGMLTGFDPPTRYAKFLKLGVVDKLLLIIIVLLTRRKMIRF